MQLTWTGLAVWLALWLAAEALAVGFCVWQRHKDLRRNYRLAWMRARIWRELAWLSGIAITLLAILLWGLSAFSLLAVWITLGVVVLLIALAAVKHLPTRLAQRDLDRLPNLDEDLPA